jgi:membrane protein YqaA with SNARE-associated domain
MKWMVKLYDKTLLWSQHQYAPHYLAAVSFVEASVFPIPPYFMLAPMALARPSKAIKYAMIATLASVFGGLLGYLLGYLVFQPLILPLLESFGYTAKYQHVSELLQAHGFVAVLIAGFMPIPYKLIAIAAGFTKLPLLGFFLASLVGRGVKFFAVALLIKAGGDRMEQHVRLMLEKLGLILCLGLVAVVFGLKFFKVI